jgi:hypothetical protein
MVLVQPQVLVQVSAAVLAFEAQVLPQVHAAQHH